MASFCHYNVKNGQYTPCIKGNKSVLFNLPKLTLTLSKLEEGGIQIKKPAEKNICELPVYPF